MQGLRGACLAVCLAVAGLLAIAYVVAPTSARAALAEERTEDKGPPVRLVIGLDLSRSNPLITNATYAASAAGFVAGRIRDLPLASSVELRTFGNFAAAENLLRINKQISTLKDEKPAAVAELVRTIIANVPQLVKTGKLTAQGSTNILPFLANVAYKADCSRMDTAVILVSDGMEESEYAHLTSAGAKLPPPSAGLFQGCSKLTIVGLGQGVSPSLAEHLRAEWSTWADTAGFQQFEGLNSW